MRTHRFCRAEPMFYNSRTFSLPQLQPSCLVMTYESFCRGVMTFRNSREYCGRHRKYRSMGVTVPTCQCFIVPVQTPMFYNSRTFSLPQLQPSCLVMTYESFCRGVMTFRNSREYCGRLCSASAERELALKLISEILHARVDGIILLGN